MDRESLFVKALSIPSPVEREAFLNKQCGDNSALRAEIESLLAAHEGAGSFLEKPPAELAATRQSNADLGEESWQSLLAPSRQADSMGVLGHYEVEELLGRGGMGVVLKARDPKLNRTVAIKLLAPELAANPMAVRRFLREAQAAAAVSHDHVMTIHAIDEAAKPPLIVMEYIPGQSLQQKIDREGALDVKSILRIGLQTAEALAAAHRQGLVHRDVKPSNILLENGIERVKLGDFGLARAVDDVGITRTGQITGTPQYMSPEQAQGENVDHRSDLFSLGCVLYAMCTGRAAFRADSAVAVLHRVIHEHPKPISVVNPEIPNWLAEIVDVLLVKDPQHRFQSTEEVADLLEAHLAHLQTPETVPRPARLLTRAKSDEDEGPDTVMGGLFLGLEAFFTQFAVIAVVFGISYWVRSNFELAGFPFITLVAIVVLVVFGTTEKWPKWRERWLAHRAGIRSNGFRSSHPSAKKRWALGGLVIVGGVWVTVDSHDAKQFIKRSLLKLGIIQKAPDGPPVEGPSDRQKRVIVPNSITAPSRTSVEVELIDSKVLLAEFQKFAMEQAKKDPKKWNELAKPFAAAMGMAQMRVYDPNFLRVTRQQEADFEKGVFDDQAAKRRIDRMLKSIDGFGVEFPTLTNQVIKEYKAGRLNGARLEIAAHLIRATLAQVNSQLRNGDAAAAKPQSITNEDSEARALFRRFERKMQQQKAVSVIYDGVLETRTGGAVKSYRYGGAWRAQPKGMISTAEFFPDGTSTRQTVGVSVSISDPQFDPAPYDFHINPLTRAGFVKRQLEWLLHPYDQSPLLTKDTKARLKDHLATPLWVNWPVSGFEIASNDENTKVQTLSYLLDLTRGEPAEVRLTIHSETLAPLSRSLKFSIDKMEYSATETYRSYSTEPVEGKLSTDDVPAAILIQGRVEEARKAGEIWVPADGLKTGEMYIVREAAEVLDFKKDAKILKLGPGRKFRVKDNGIEVLSLPKTSAQLVSPKLEQRKVRTIPVNFGAFEFAPNGEWLITGGIPEERRDDLAQIWDLQQDALPRKIALGNDVYDFAIHPASRRFVPAGGSNQVYVFDQAGKRLMRLDPTLGTPFQLAYSPNGAYLAAGSPHRVALLDAKNGQLLWDRSLKNLVNAVCFSPDGKQLAAALGRSGELGSGEVVVWDLPSGLERFRLKGHTKNIPTVAYSPDGKLIATAGGLQVLSNSIPEQELRDRAGEVIFWDANTGKELHRFEAHKSRINSVAFSPDGNLFATTGRDATIRIWRMQPSKTELVERVELLILREDPGGNAEWDINRVAFSPDGKLLASGSMRQVILWDVSDLSKRHAVSVTPFALARPAVAECTIQKRTSNPER